MYLWDDCQRFPPKKGGGGGGGGGGGTLVPPLGVIVEPLSPFASFLTPRFFPPVLIACRLSSTVVIATKLGNCSNDAIYSPGSNLVSSCSVGDLVPQLWEKLERKVWKGSGFACDTVPL